jgi:hypothetical protein
MRQKRAFTHTHALSVEAYSRYLLGPKYTIDNRTNAMFRRDVSGSVPFVDLGSFHLRLKCSLALKIPQTTWVGTV